MFILPQVVFSYVLSAFNTMNVMQMVVTYRESPCKNYGFYLIFNDEAL